MYDYFPLEEIKGGGHSYGFYSDKAYVKRIVVENTVDFFADKLLKQE